MPLLYRDAPLGSIWEGSGNVSALDVLRAMAKEPEGLPAFLAECEFYGLGIDHPTRLPALIGAVDRAQIGAAARRYLDLSRHVLVVAGPAPKEEELR